MHRCAKCAWPRCVNHFVTRNCKLVHCSQEDSTYQPKSFTIWTLQIFRPTQRYKHLPSEIKSLSTTAMLFTLNSSKLHLLDTSSSALWFLWPIPWRAVYRNTSSTTLFSLTNLEWLSLSAMLFQGHVFFSSFKLNPYGHNMLRASRHIGCVQWLQVLNPVGMIVISE